MIKYCGFTWDWERKPCLEMPCRDCRCYECNARQHTSQMKLCLLCEVCENPDNRPKVFPKEFSQSQ